VTIDPLNFNKNTMSHFKKLAVTTSISATVLLATFSGTVLASKELAQKNACMSCHAAEKKLLGPAYSAVAAKYKDQKDAVATLAKSIKAGGQGKWGAIPMPAQTALSDSDATVLATWILGGAK
jgi:cytochrome c